MNYLKTLIIFVTIMFLFDTVHAEMVIKVADFEKGFSHWKVKEFKGKAVYTVKSELKKSLILTSNGTSFSLARELKFDLSSYPFLNFEWKVIAIPEKGDVRNKKTDDQAAQIYVIIPSFPEMINYKAIGYIWDSNAPLGVYDSKKTSNIKFIVLKSGKRGLDTWFSEKVNVYEDFKKLWKMDIRNKKIVVSVSIDSDDTESNAESAFGEIYFSQK